jgi:glycosyltransferase involved in cell wall biosynthesis
VRLLSVGRFCEKKGFNYLLKACRLLWANDLDFTCTLVGYGPLQSQIEQWIDDYQLNGIVTLAGKLTQDEVLEQYRQADAFVLPCVVTEDGDRDGIPNVLLEAMATGLPVVSTDISGIGELVQSGHNGLLVPERDAVALADALQQLMADTQWRSQLGHNGQQTVRQRFALTQNVGDVKKLLLKALTHQTSQPSQLHVSTRSVLPYVDQLEAALS